MLKHLIICCLIGMAACTSANDSDKSGASRADDDDISIADIQGQWEIEKIVENDSSSVAPAEVEDGITALIDFREDNTFGIMTNCNHLGGLYRQTNDSLLLTDIATTEMACDNMEVEEMLRKVLPLVAAVDRVNDSVTRLKSGKGDAYIILKKRGIAVK